MVGVNMLIHAPPALSHVFVHKYGTLESSVFVGNSPSFSKVYADSRPRTYEFAEGSLWHKGVNGGYSGMMFCSFMSSPNSKKN